MDTERYRIAGIEINAGTQEVLCDGRAVVLPPLSFALLLTLARHAPNVVTTAELEQEVWTGVVVDRGTINKRVVLVRQALREAGCKDDIIAVVRGTGYRLSAPVQRLGEIGEELPGPSPDPATQAPAPRREPWRIVAMLSMLIAMVSIALWIGHGLTGPGHPAVVADPGGLAPEVSLAVIPFSDASSEENGAHLGAGVAREIAGLLDAVDGIVVASGSEALRSTGAGVEPAELARRLDVDAVLSGELSVDQQEITVDVSLFDRRAGNAVWSERYRQQLEQVFAIQDDVAAHVAMSLQVPLSELPRLDSRQATTSDIRAFTQYLKGRALLDDRVAGRGDSVRRALTNFRAAVERDPNFVDAHVGVAAALFLLPFYDPRLEQQALLDEAETSARYALELDPGSPQALGVLAGITGMRGDSTQSAALFEQALALGERDPDLLIWGSMVFNSLGYFERLDGMLEEGFRMHPLNRLLGCSLAANQALMGHPEAASQVLRSLPSFPRRDLSLALVSLHLGDFDTAREMLQGLTLRMGTLPEDWADLLVTAVEDPRQRGEVERAFLEAVENGDMDRRLAFESLLIVGSPAALDLDVDLDGTLFENRLPELVWNNWAVELRRDPRFKQWVRSLGYERYWRQFGWPDRCKPTAVDDFECV